MFYRNKNDISKKVFWPVIALSKSRKYGYYVSRFNAVSEGWAYPVPMGTELEECGAYFKVGAVIDWEGCEYEIFARASAIESAHEALCYYAAQMDKKAAAGKAAAAQPKKQWVCPDCGQADCDGCE